MVPAAWGGAVTMRVVGEIQVIFVAGTESNITMDFLPSLLPWIVTIVPPAVDPLTVEILAMIEGASFQYLPATDVPLVPAAPVAETSDIISIKPTIIPAIIKNFLIVFDDLARFFRDIEMSSDPLLLFLAELLKPGLKFSYDLIKKSSR